MAAASATEKLGGGVDFAALSDTGNERAGNEDACGSHSESPTHVLVAVADGVGGEEGGEVASQMAIDVTLRTYRESPASWGASKRLYRAVQQANIEIHDRALVVTELRRMSTTITALVVDGDVAHAAHVGDSRLYLVRNGRITQKTKDHTVLAGRLRMHATNRTSERASVERSTLTRSLGRELIAAVDRLTFPVARDDVLLLCSDGLYNVLGEDELRQVARETDSAVGCRNLIDAANARGTPDNVTAIVVRILDGAPLPERSGWLARMARFVGR
jgi:protein phosphatase